VREGESECVCVKREKRYLTHCWPSICPGLIFGLVYYINKTSSKKKKGGQKVDCSNVCLSDKDKSSHQESNQ